MKYDHNEIEARWRAWWDEHDTFRTPSDRSKPKYYVLDMFPYPSGSGLHVGHPKGYVATDVVARARRMMGFNVLRPMGWDSFGLPAERQAVREGKHPREITQRNIATFKGQLEALGLSYDWSRELATSDPSYYKWTQWIFLQLHQKGLAYKASVPVNWCPALGTVLANEEVVDGRYVETGDVVERRLMSQWMLRITDYAESLLAGLETLDWPEGIKAMQREWIGRSEGARIRFVVAGDDGGASSRSFDVFTTRPDTLFGCTYVVLAPEHPLVEAITQPAQADAVAEYVQTAANKSERDRTTQAADAPKTGVFTGAHAIHPITGEAVPIWIADYVLARYGTGAVFACPAHDERDHAFAKTFGLAIVEVVAGGGDVQAEAFTGDGAHVNSDFLDGMDIAAAKRAIVAWLEQRDEGEGTVQYRLRDWLFSRQRYWGEPFPVIELADGSTRALGEADLPITLPEIDEYMPTKDGEPPLARAADWVATTDPETGAPATRETNTMPQWAGSCWYYLRFINPDRDDVAWDRDDEAYWMPVDLYVGGAEHAVLHLLYARFWHHVLHDLGLVSCREPFQRLFNQGMVHATSYREQRWADDDGELVDDAKVVLSTAEGEATHADTGAALQPRPGPYHYPHEVEELEGSEGVFVVKDTGVRCVTSLDKMSKSRYNVENPDDLCQQYGADALRLYELFMGPLEATKPWNMEGVNGVRNFLDRAWRMIIDYQAEQLQLAPPVKEVELTRDQAQCLHATIQAVTRDTEAMSFNTAIARMMEFVNFFTPQDVRPQQAMETFVLLLAPYAPHIAEELWAALGHASTLAHEPWPAFDESLAQKDTVEVPIQICGKFRTTIEVPTDLDREQLEAAALADERVQALLADRQIVKTIVVPGRMVNFVIK